MTVRQTDDGSSAKSCLIAASQFLVPASEIKRFSGGEEEGARKVDGVVGAKRMGAGTVGGLPQKRIGDGVDIDPAPEILQVMKCSTKLGRAFWQVSGALSRRR